MRLHIKMYRTQTSNGPRITRKKRTKITHMYVYFKNKKGKAFEY